MKISVKNAITKSRIVDAVMEQFRETPGYISSFYGDVDGVVLDASPEWLLIREMDGITADGYAAVLRENVRWLQNTKYDLFRQQALQSEGAWQQIIRKPSIDLSSAATILTSLRRKARFAIVVEEDWFDSEWTSSHCRVETVGRNHVFLRGFDGLGQWGRLRRRKLKDITRIYFGSKYLRFYERHAAKTSAV
jgi:hypothetical protein